MTERQPRDKRKNEDNETMIDKLTYINSQDLFADASAIIETAKNIACRSINITLVQYGSGFDFSSLYKYIRFYQCFPNILDAASPKSFLLT